MNLESAPAPGTAEPTSVSELVAYLPSAEEYEINWDEEDTTATGAKSAQSPPGKTEATKAVVTSTGVWMEATTNVAMGESTIEAPASYDRRKTFKFQSLAEQFPDLPSTKRRDNQKDKETDNNKARDLQPKEALDISAQPSAVRLASTLLEAELERRMARAARFGPKQADPDTAGLHKGLERVVRFGGSATTGDARSTIGVAALDQALSETTGRRVEEHESFWGRGRVQKRAQGGARRGGRGGGRSGVMRNGDVRNQQRKRGDAVAVNSVLDDPVEREKAEKRKNRFGAVA